MSWFEWTRIDNQASRDSFDFWERVSHSNDAKPPLNKAYVSSWVVGRGVDGGAGSQGSLMVEQLPVEFKRVRGLPIYYDPNQLIWFVDGYPENFQTEAEATAFAESLVPYEPSTETPPVNPIEWVSEVVGAAILVALLV